ncbi:MAG: hypothetical protein Q7R42_06005, partial [Candidatus Planktophila sp.]|nr:hypothetical protein [Candidatus Planktophila sp.]
ANESTHPDDRPTHYKYFGDTGKPDSANISFWVTYYPDGRIEESGFLYNIEESSDPEDAEEVAKWCLDAAAFGREVRGAMVIA